MKDLYPEEQDPQFEELITLLRHADLNPPLIDSSEHNQIIANARARLFATEPEVAQHKMQELGALSGKPKTQRRKPGGIVHVFNVLAAVLVVAFLIGSTLLLFGPWTSLHRDYIGTTNTNHHSQSTPSSSPTDYLANMNAWQVEPNYFFQGSQYHILSKPPMNFSVALYNFGSTQFTNFRITVTTSEIHGIHNDGDFYGIVLRSSGDLKHYYLFEITPSSEGEYEFWRSDIKQPLINGHLPSNSHTLNQTYVISIEVKNNSFTFFVNNKQLGNPFIDTSNHLLSSGAIGLSVEGNNTEVAFSQLYINIL